MSTSKFMMACKLSNVQQKLMAVPIDDLSLDGLLPLIYKECLQEKLMFWFNFMEDACVLNLRDIEHENHELNIRYAYEKPPINRADLEYYKYYVLINAFIITSNPVTLTSADESNRATVQQNIISSDKPVPKSINDAIKRIKSKGMPVTADTIRNHLPTSQMSTSETMKCNKYLKEMKEAEQ